MGRVEWIKLDVDVFRNPKLKRVRREEYGNDKLLVWIMLLTTAGRCNEGGRLRMGDGTPYTIDDLSDEFGISYETVDEAMKSFIKYGLVEDYDGCYGLPGWEEHQNEDGLAKIREQTKARVAKHRLKHSNASSNVTKTEDVTPCNVTVTLRNATEEEKEKEEDLTILYPIIAASQHGQRAMRTLSISGITKEALDEADEDDDTERIIDFT